MSYDFTKGGGNATAVELVTGIYDQVDAAFYDVLYPEIQWKNVISPKSILTDINPGALNYVYRSRDRKGVGQFIRGSVANIPRVGQVVGQITVPMCDAAVGAEITNAEARQYQYGFQTALAKDLGEVKRQASEYHVERGFFFGDTNVGFLPFLDYPTVEKIPVDAWEGTDPSEWVYSIVDAQATMYENSKTLHLADTVYLPPNRIAMLQRAMVLGTNGGVMQNALEFLRINNLYTAMTSKSLNIKPLRYLQGAGLAGVDRIILQDSNPENFAFPFPMQFQLSQPVPIPLGVATFAEYKYGSFHVRRPLAMTYVDVADAGSE